MIEDIRPFTVGDEVMRRPEIRPDDECYVVLDVRDNGDLLVAGVHHVGVETAPAAHFEHVSDRPAPGAVVIGRALWDAADWPVSDLATVLAFDRGRINAHVPYQRRDIR